MIDTHALIRAGRAVRGYLCGNAAAALMLLLFAAGAAVAGEADVLAVKAQKAGDGSFSFEVTVRHTDTGWDHYADKWDIVAPDGRVIATRVLYHPHVGEQPFTRGLSGVDLPPEIEQVTVRAHDSVHEYGGETIRVTLPR